ncbi:ABC transporter ATP-binding protein [Polymorphum gilvum]|uniref:ABC transporter, ATPase subunit n=1 Tax=Polymorphum gilvum (strain LMG 25793 / CGMCC 1.9160 / SL003B-26A1) TaxID=991905 RepID=F2IWT0_POLGS|nr:ABC transporter ATP-binding protein [Polymorphum gilvum]ADZ71507.1 ABC transporter, ATPase subunit [Polymorphum gilvum SL003B-26A1]
MAFLDLKNLRKSFGALTVVKDFSLSVEAGEFVSLLGPSGCGKTTVLRMVAGFETPSSGAIEIADQDVTRVKANARNIGMVFQAYALFPNLTVAQNVAFGLKVKGMKRAETDARVAEMLKLIGLPDLGGRYPFQLSGGQQQRVALARALAPRPRVLLLDEPLSALDAKIRVSLRAEIREIQRELGITTIFVTHDQEEALSMSDRIVVMNGGVAEQVGVPFEIYNRPATRFVANFVGTLNTFQARIDDADRSVVSLAGVPLTLPGGGLDGRAGDSLAIALRPEALHLGRYDGCEAVLPATIEDVHFMGSIIRLRIDIAGTRVALDTFNRVDQPPPTVGSSIEVSLSPRDVIVLQG